MWPGSESQRTPPSSYPLPEVPFPPFLGSRCHRLPPALFAHFWQTPVGPLCPVYRHPNPSETRLASSSLVTREIFRNNFTPLPTVMKSEVGLFSPPSSPPSSSFHPFFSLPCYRKEKLRSGKRNYTLEQGGQDQGSKPVTVFFLGSLPERSPLSNRRSSDFFSRFYFSCYKSTHSTKSTQKEGATS